MPSTNPVITWRRNSQPIVGMLLKPVRYRSKWIAAVAISSPPPAMRRASRGQPATGRGSLLMSILSGKTCAVSVPVAPGAAAAGAAARAAAGAAAAGGGRRRGKLPAGRGNCPPQAAGGVQAVALGLAGRGVAHVGVQGTPVICGLLHT